MTASVVVRERAYAKINLFLEVLGKRPDGFHDLDTVMHEIDLHDELELRTDPDIDDVRLSCDDQALDVGEDNLVIQAVRAVERHVGRTLPCRLRLEKRIPAGGGLGGGSSDAAATVRALDRAFDLGMSVEAMEEIVATFGSDTAFFVRGGTSRCTGRGEILEPIDVSERFSFVLILPAIHVPTARVFKDLRLTGSPRGGYDLHRTLRIGEPADLRQELFNRLESTARTLYPELDHLLESVRSFGPIMSGSGSSIFVLCDGPDHAEETRSAMSSVASIHMVTTTSARR